MQKGADYSPRCLTCTLPEFFTGDDTLLCTFDRGHVFMIKGVSFRGAELEVFSVEAAPMAVKARS